MERRKTMTDEHYYVETHQYAPFGRFVFHRLAYEETICGGCLLEHRWTDQFIRL